jgi:hypothetical protein
MLLHVAGIKVEGQRDQRRQDQMAQAKSVTVQNLYLPLATN